VKSRIRQNSLALLAALIWGFGFSAQSMSAEYIGPFTFNCVRNIIAFVALLLIDLAAARFIPGRRNMFQLDRAEKKTLLAGGCACGAMLALASFAQQLGITVGTPAGKAGFITAMYIVLVPLLSLVLFRRKPTLLLAGSVVLAVGGLYFLSVTEAFTVAAGDLIVMLCALLYAGHILVIDRFSPHLDGIHMSCIQFLAAAVISGVGMFAAERSSLPGIAMCLLPLLYAGLFSSAAGYTLQILAQKGADPTVVSILLSLESVFAVIGGALLLGERMGVRELLGCALMMAAVILAQLPGASGEQRQSGES